MGRGWGNSGVVVVGGRNSAVGGGLIVEGSSTSKNCPSHHKYKSPK